jgi:hypothetical protein
MDDLRVVTKAEQSQHDKETAGMFSLLFCDGTHPESSLDLISASHGFSLHYSVAF